MSTVRRFWPATRLKTLVSMPGGMLASEAIARADERLEKASEACLAGVDLKIESLVQLSATRAQGGDRAQIMARIYRLSNEVFAESGVFGRAALSTAAQSLCDLTSSGDALDDAVWNGIDVHVQSMRVLRQGNVESSDQMCQAVLAGLQNVARRVGRSEN